MQLLVQEVLCCPQLPHAATMLGSDDLEDSLPQCRLCSPGSGPRGNDASLLGHFFAMAALCWEPSKVLGMLNSPYLKNTVSEHFKQLFRQLRAVRPLHFHLLLPGEALGGGMWWGGACTGRLPGAGCAGCYSACKLHQSLRTGVRAAGCDETGKMKLIMTLRRC